MTRSSPSRRSLRRQADKSPLRGLPDLESELETTRHALEAARAAHAELATAFEHLRSLYAELAEVNAKLERALEQSRSVEAAARGAFRPAAVVRMGDLTTRQSEVLQLI